MASKKKLDEFRKLAIQRGARDAKVISPPDVVTAEWVRLKCQYGCGGYGRCLTCPPHSPTPDSTRKVLDCYTHGVLFQGDRTANIRKLGAELERDVFLAGFYKAFAYLCGPCRLCGECGFEEGCRHPDEARPAMEAAGIDVFATARAAGFPIEVVTSGECEQNYYGLVLIE